MKMLRAYRYGWFLLPVMVASLLACSKVSVDLPTTVQTSDPDVSYIDGYTVQLGTLQLDSFVTSGRSSFVIGNHQDPWFGHVTAGSYSAVTPPTSNPVKDQTVFLDSICLLLRPNGMPYGDSATGSTLRVYKVTDPITAYEGNAGSFYNTGSFNHESMALGTRSFVLRPSVDTLVSIRLTDALGQDWLDKLRRNDAEIQSASGFADYFRGVYIDADTTTTRSLYFYTSSKGGAFIRLYYHANQAIPEQLHVDFSQAAEAQFSHLDIKHDGTPLSVFTPGKREMRGSEQTGGRAYLNATMGEYIRLTFPGILNLKELHPYVQVIRAQLEIPPTPGSTPMPYTLPTALNLYSTNNASDLGVSVKLPGTSTMATGNLYIDALYGKDTKYTYDVTTFIQGILTTGEFANKSLMLVPGSYGGYDSFRRLQINDQSLANGIKLRLYVLGL